MSISRSNHDNDGTQNERNAYDVTVSVKVDSLDTVSWLLYSVPLVRSTRYLAYGYCSNILLSHRMFLSLPIHFHRHPDLRWCSFLAAIVEIVVAIVVVGIVVVIIRKWKIYFIEESVFVTVNSRYFLYFYSKLCIRARMYIFEVQCIRFMWKDRFDRYSVKCFFVCSFLCDFFSVRLSVYLSISLSVCLSVWITLALFTLGDFIPRNGSHEIDDFASIELFITCTSGDVTVVVVVTIVIMVAVAIMLTATITVVAKLTMMFHILIYM